MSKWVVLGLLAAIALGLGLWVAIDPEARRGAAQTWTQSNAGDLLAPIAGAFKDLADSVGGLWSASAIRIEVPRIELPR
ncbi:MAG: hypothetical protein V1755_03280 [Chloroflexota bacterium]